MTVSKVDRSLDRKFATDAFGSIRAHRAKRELPFKRSGIPAAV
jgi:hypothetical protein